jgi:hypothetical protein
MKTSTETTLTRLLVTTEWDLWVQLVVTVDPDSSGFKRIGNSVSPGDVLGKDGVGKTVNRVVGGCDDFLFGLESGENDNGAEDLFSDDLHVGVDVGEDCLKSVGEGKIKRNGGKH